MMYFMRMAAYFVVALVSVSFLPVESQTEAKDNKRQISSNWTYSVRQGKAMSKRLYLLVANPGTKQERQFDVMSDCTKMFPSESTYGSCTHHVTERQTDKALVLKTGEELILTNTLGEMSGLATIEYGCCAGPSVISFYTDRGELIGYIFTDQRPHAMIGRTWNFSNGGGELMLLMGREPLKSPGFSIASLDSRGEVKRQPVTVVNPEEQRCDYWAIEHFGGYANKEGIFLAMNGHICDPITVQGLCTIENEGWLCKLASVQNKP
jgi:hypothetical protein